MIRPTNHRVLVTGAAGFVGSHTVDLLVEAGYPVTALDALDPQVHGRSDTPRNIARHVDSGAVRFVRGDVRDRELIAGLVGETDRILHLAAAVGVGQSMYMPRHYSDVNIGGTATIMDVLANQPHSVRRVVVASSMSIYGEGQYTCPSCGPMFPNDRSARRLQDNQWEHLCPSCSAPVVPATTPEAKPLYSTSIYAITKKVQEEMLLVFGKSYGLPVTALRYFNIYGPRQSLNNPYTGAAAIFLSRLLNDKPPVVFEDGLQSRDFIHVRDVARANVLALETEQPGQHVYNVGTGRATSILEVAEILARGLQLSIRPQVENQFRAGDIRHCFADASKIARDLGFQAKITCEEGFRDLIEFSRNDRPSDHFEASLAELRSRNLVS